jgi:two-component sensor histidine kinase
MNHPLTVAGTPIRGWRRPLGAWLWLLVTGVPMWALFVALILTAHGPAAVTPVILLGLRMSISVMVLAYLVLRLLRLLPWPSPFRLRFLGIHLLVALGFGLAWIASNSLLESLVRHRAVLAIGPGLGPYLVLGVWIYLMIAGIAYAIESTERAALAEATAAKARLAALRAQLNPHFLFNALHTIVQLIPLESGRATWAIEQLASLLRTTLEEDRDQVSVAAECAFVERYLEIERLRFGDRLRVEVEIAEEAREALLPSFAVQTLVENALRHGAAPAVEPTDVIVRARLSGSVLELEVRDTGAGATPGQVAASTGTALARLRGRLAALYGSKARLETDSRPGGGFTARLTIPQELP